MSDQKPPEPPPVRITAEQALAATRQVRERAAPLTLHTVLSALSAVHRGERAEVTLGYAEANAILNEIQDVRRELGLSKAHVGRLIEARKADARERDEMRAELQTWMAKGKEFERRLR